MNLRIIPGADFRNVHDMIGTDTLIEINEFARMAGIHPATMRNLVGRGALSYVQISPRRKCIPTNQLTRTIADNLRAYADGVKELRSQQVVYFMQAGEDGPIKIGIASNLERRLFELQQGHYETLRILASTPGGLSLEREYHRDFAGDRIRGEWFRNSDRIQREIAKISAA